MFAKTKAVPSDTLSADPAWQVNIIILSPMSGAVRTDNPRMSTTWKWAVRLPVSLLSSRTSPSPAGAAAQAPADAGKSFLWKVQAGSKVVYLAGSVHALGADVYPLSPAYENAFAASGTLVEEINLAEAERWPWRRPSSPRACTSMDGRSTASCRRRPRPVSPAG